MSRHLLGLSVGSGLEAADAAIVLADAVGLDLSPRVTASARVAFPPSMRDAIRAATGSPELTRHIAETLVHAARQVFTRAGLSPRDTFVAGLLEPGRPPVELGVPWPEIADRVAEQTGLTVVHGFRHRDRAASGAGHPIAAVADCLLFRSPTRVRLLVHLGAVTSLLLLPPGAKASAVVGFEAGPGNQLLDAIVFHGTRGKETNDPGGKKAVQGRCLEPLLARWLEHPHLTRTPPKTVHADAFGRGFLLAAFESGATTRGRASRHALHRDASHRPRDRRRGTEVASFGRGVARSSCHRRRRRTQRLPVATRRAAIPRRYRAK